MSLLYPEESYKITGAIYEVHKHLGPGLLEKVYQEALEKEFKLQGIPFEREKSFTITTMEPSAKRFIYRRSNNCTTTKTV